MEGGNKDSVTLGQINNGLVPLLSKILGGGDEARLRVRFDDLAVPEALCARHAPG